MVRSRAHSGAIVLVRSSAKCGAARREMLAGAVASWWEHGGAARGERLPGGVRSVLTTAKKLPVALRRRGAALYWIAAVAPATRARPELASERRRPARRNEDGDGSWGGEASPRRGRPNPRRRTSRPRADGPGAAALWNTTCEVTRDRICYGLKDQGSTAPVRTLALASFSLLTFLSLFLSSFLASLDESFLSLSSFLEESLESLDLSLESFFSSFLTAFSSCVRRARDGARAARGAVDAKNHHAIAATGASRRHREHTFFFSFSLALAFSALSYSSADFCFK